MYGLFYLLFNRRFHIYNIISILIKENTDTPIFLTFKENYIMNLEYIILNLNSPVIISVYFEEMCEIILSYIISNGKDTNDQGDKYKNYHIFFSQNIIIYEDEIKKNCNTENKEGRVLCKLIIDISRKSYDSYDSQYLSKKVLLTVNIKSNYEKHVSYLNVNNLYDGIMVGDQFQYYYANIRQYDHGSIVLKNKKGLGLMYARIINKDTIDENGEWNGRIHLLYKDEIEYCNDCLIYDINTNEIIFTEKDTQNCNSDMRCQIIIGISIIENKEDNID